MYADAVTIRHAGSVGLERLALKPAGRGDIVVESVFSGISTGTEKLLFEERMPYFPGLSYPLVPGYETVGRVVEAGPESGCNRDELVFIPGAQCFEEAAGLFGATASHLVTGGDRAIKLPDAIGIDGTLLALGATAHHAVGLAGPPELIIGHGVLGRICARMVVALGFPAPTVWEIDPARRDGAIGYAVSDSESDETRQYRTIMDASGDCGILDKAVSRLSHGGEITLAGFYDRPLSFSFPPAFMREARIRIAAEFTPRDTRAVLDLVVSGRLDLSGLISHQAAAADAPSSYPAAFENGDCLKMVLDWRQ